MKIVFFDFMDVPAYDCDTPYSKGLGGTQSAICYYAEVLAKSHDVHVVLSNCTEQKKIRDVYFEPMTYVTNKVECDVLIWCSGVNKNGRSLLQKYVNSNLSICWIPHNTNEPGMNDLEELIYDFDVFAFVSEWQRKKYIDVYGIDVQKTMIMLLSLIHI